jgi:WD40 repeat protein
VAQCVHLAREARACITGSVDKTVKIWSLSDYECINTLIGHTGSVNDVQQLDDIIISTSMHDKTVRFWDPVSATCLHTVESKDGVACLAVNQARFQSGHVYFGTVDGNVVQWDVEAQQAVSSQKIAMGMVESLQVCGQVIIASDYTRINLQSLDDPTQTCVSPMMNRNVGRLHYDGYRLGVQVGTRLSVFDVRYLFERRGEIAIDNLWKVSLFLVVCRT